jgi:coenzyme Q-binding protein COQ10
MSRLTRFTQKKLVGYSVEEMYSLAADTKSYQEFVPFVAQSKVLQKDFNTEQVLLKIGFRQTNLSFISRVDLLQDKQVKATAKSPLFKALNAKWDFLPSKHVQKSSLIDMRVDFEFNSMLLATLSSVFFERTCLEMISAFEKRALVLYGKPSFPSRTI